MLCCSNVDIFAPLNSKLKWPLALVSFLGNKTSAPKVLVVVFFNFGQKLGGSVNNIVRKKIVRLLLLLYLINRISFVVPYILPDLLIQVIE